MAAPAAAINMWPSHDASKRFFADDFAQNVLRSLPPNAIYFTVGDNDTFPVLYMQAVEGVRRDVQVVNVNLTYSDVYLEGLLRLDPAFPLTPGLPYARWPSDSTRTDSTFELHVSGEPGALGLASDETIPEVLTVHAKPRYTKTMYLGDFAIIDIVTTNMWRRPLTFAMTATESRDWLEPFTRLDGLYWRVVPSNHPRVRLDTLVASLFRNEFRGFNDGSVALDDVTRSIGDSYYGAFDVLLAATRANEGDARCKELERRIEALAPRARLEGVAVGATARKPLCTDR